MHELLYILMLLGVLWFWRDSANAREKATSAARAACTQINAQFLDETVMMVKLRLCRRNTGTMALCRLYNFDFTVDGSQRRSGVIQMKAQIIEDILLDIDKNTVLQQ
jgi:hypothetical protein